MSLHNTGASYGSMAKTFHWLIAILIIVAWIVGYYAMEFVPRNDPNLGTLFSLHKSIGMLVLILVCARLAWRLYDGSPKMYMTNRLMIVSAYTVHYLLYVVMFLQTISGWAMSSAANHTPTFFGLFTFPPLVKPNPAIIPELVGLHNSAALVLLTLFVLHVGGALFHHYVLKDNTLRRMTVD